MLVPVVLYYPTPTTAPPLHDDHDSFASELTQRLTHSLSLVLTRFYPLAGRANPGGQSIDCNDQGVPFSVVKFTGHNLSDLLTNPDPTLPGHLLPCEVTWETACSPDSSVALIQVNLFDCGGVAIGAVFSHKIADAMTIGNFLTSWANTTRPGSRQPVSPNYISLSMFPHNEKIKVPGSMSGIVKTGKSVMHRYVFDAAAIASLKARSPAVERPTRVEVVSAVIWKAFMAASPASATLLTHIVNLRSRVHPPLSSDCFGNFPAMSAAACNQTSDEEEEDLSRLVMRIRDSIRKIDGEFVERMVINGVAGFQENARLTWSEVPEGADPICFSSWCGFGLYGIDFGWGKPEWVTRNDAGSDSESSRFLNVVWLIESGDGGGVEAWVILDEKYMSVFDRVKDLRALASVDLSPLISTVG